MLIEDESDLTPGFVADHVLPHLPDGIGPAFTVTKGYEFHVLDFGSHIVRLPGPEGAFGDLVREAAFCRLLPNGKLETPDLTISYGDYPFSWHPKLLGETFMPDHYQAMDEARKDQTASDIADLFVAMHNLPPDQVRKAGIGAVYDFFPRDAMIGLQDILADDLKDQFEKAMADWSDLTVEDTDLVPGHFDVHGWNMAFDAKAQRVAGVFDFADCGIGDRAREFSPLNGVSADLTRRVMDHYQARTGLAVSWERVCLYTLLYEYDDLFASDVEGPALIDRGRDHYFTQLRRWQRELGN